MEKIKLEKYKDLINKMPIDEHSSTCEWKGLWEEMSDKHKLIKKMFNENGSIVISRKDIFDQAKKMKSDDDDDIHRFILMTLMWGFPSGNRGHVKELLKKDNFKLLVELIEGIIHKKFIIDDWNQHRKDVENKKIKGSGPSTYTKLLYFMRVKVKSNNEYNRCLIFDLNIIKVFEKNTFTKFNEKAGIKYGLKSYPIYLREMDRIAKGIGLKDKDKLEMFLFLFGTSLKAMK